MGKRSLPTSFDVNAVERLLKGGPTMDHSQGHNDIQFKPGTKPLRLPDTPIRPTTVEDHLSEFFLTQAETLSNLVEARDSEKITFEATLLIEPFDSSWWKCERTIGLHLGFVDTHEAKEKMREWMNDVLAPYYYYLEKSYNGNILNGIRSTSGNAFVWLRTMERTVEGVGGDYTDPDWLALPIVQAVRRNCPNSWMIVFTLFEIYEANCHLEDFVQPPCRASLLDDKGQVRWYALWGAIRFWVIELDKDGANDPELHPKSIDPKSDKQSGSVGNKSSNAKGPKKKAESSESVGKSGSGSVKKGKGLDGVLDEADTQPANDTRVDEEIPYLGLATEDDLELARALAQPEGYYI